MDGAGPSRALADEISRSLQQENPLFTSVRVQAHPVSDDDLGDATTTVGTDMPRMPQAKSLEKAVDGSGLVGENLDLRQDDQTPHALTVQATSPTPEDCGKAANFSSGRSHELGDPEKPPISSKPCGKDASFSHALSTVQDFMVVEEVSAVSVLDTVSQPRPPNDTPGKATGVQEAAVLDKEVVLDEPAAPQQSGELVMPDNNTAAMGPRVSGNTSLSNEPDLLGSDRSGSVRVTQPSDFANTQSENERGVVSPEPPKKGGQKDVQVEDTELNEDRSEGPVAETRVSYLEERAVKSQSFSCESTPPPPPQKFSLQNTAGSDSVTSWGERTATHILDEVVRRCESEEWSDIQWAEFYEVLSDKLTLRSARHPNAWKNSRLTKMQRYAKVVHLSKQKFSEQSAQIEDLQESLSRRDKEFALKMKERCDEFDTQLKERGDENDSMRNEIGKLCAMIHQHENTISQLQAHSKHVSNVARNLQMYIQGQESPPRTTNCNVQARVDVDGASWCLVSDRVLGKEGEGSEVQRLRWWPEHLVPDVQCEKMKAVRVEDHSCLKNALSRALEECRQLKQQLKSSPKLESKAPAIEKSALSTAPTEITVWKQKELAAQERIINLRDEMKVLSYENASLLRRVAEMGKEKEVNVAAPTRAKEESVVGTDEKKRIAFLENLLCEKSESISRLEAQLTKQRNEIQRLKSNAPESMSVCLGESGLSKSLLENEAFLQEREKQRLLLSSEGIEGSYRSVDRNPKDSERKSSGHRAVDEMEVVARVNVVDFSNHQSPSNSPKNLGENQMEKMIGLHEKVDNT